MLLYCDDLHKNLQVMDIQKLAVEMGLNCITAYRLDALKAVACFNGSADPVTETRDEGSFGTSINDSGRLGFPEEGKVSVTLKCSLV